MSWRDRLLNGSWRGFDFLTEEASSPEGRRLVQQQYPRRDDPDVEDMGLDKSQPYRVNAYFIGPDYDLEANGFTEKLRISGADWLTHPYLGDLWVHAWKWTRSENIGQGGYCKISIDFMPAGQQPYEPDVDKVDVAISRVREAQTVIVDDFALQEMSSDIFNDMIADVQGKLEGLRRVIAVATLPLTRANQVMTVITGVKSDLNTLLGLPQQYANALAGFANLLGFLDDPDDALDVPGRVRVISRVSSLITNPPELDSNSTQTAALIANNAAEDAMRNQMLLTSLASLALTTYKDADTRDNVLQTVLTAFDSQLNNASGNVFNALLDLQAAIIDALLDQDLSKYRQREIVNFLPAAVLAHQFGISEDDFIAINQVTHPLFVAGKVNG